MNLMPYDGNWNLSKYHQQPTKHTDTEIMSSWAEPERSESQPPKEEAPETCLQQINLYKRLLLTPWQINSLQTASMSGISIRY